MAKPEEDLKQLQSRLEAMEKEIKTLQFRYNKLRNIVMERDQMIVELLRAEFGQ
jgi:chaperonin cofactor prefoldin